MAAPTVAILMPADMGGAIAQRLIEAGAHVVTNLEGRSARTRKLAAQSGATLLDSDAALVSAADMILSIVAPEAAIALAERIAPAIKASGKAPLYVDCNAISPATAATIETIVTQSGARMVGAGIIGLPPRGGATTHIYASGEAAQDFAALGAYGLTIKVISARVGDASALKMCYAAFNKGSYALIAQVLTAAERLGVTQALQEEFASSQKDRLPQIKRALPACVPKAFRFAGEMREIAETFESIGVTPRGFLGAADMFEAIAATPLGQMRVEDWAKDQPPFEEIVRSLAQYKA